jgi:hypothetical protein
MRGQPNVARDCLIHEISSNRPKNRRTPNGIDQAALQQLDENTDEGLSLAI